MKIVTVNIPEAYLDAINKLIGEDGLYPSRSELIRCAVREFLIKELNMAKNMVKYSEDEQDFDEENYVKIPEVSTNEKGETVKEFKTFKIIQRLE